MTTPAPKYPALDVEVDNGVDGRVESITADRVTVAGLWSAAADLILRPNSPVVVLTREEYEDLAHRSGICGCG
jgi:hypothetical protein